MISYVKRDPYLKRVPTVIDRTYGIQAYDIDNLYPQRADEVRNRSFTTKSAVDRLAEFIDGEGFQDQALANLIFNLDGMTGNDLLDLIAQDKAPFNGFALHIKYNLNYRISEITPVDFMYCRLGLPDHEGIVHDIKYNCNWEMDYSKTIDRVFEVHEYPIFNPDPEVVKAQMDQYGWEDYPGQILYWTPKPGIYPKASFDSVFDQAQSQSEIGVYELSSIQNNFGIEKIFKYPGSFANDEEKRKFKRELNEFKGANGAKSTMVVEDPDGDGRQLIENIQMQNTDKMFEFTSKNVKNSIRESMSVPAEILGQLPETGMFNKQQIEDAYTYFNAITRGHRNQISRLFQKVMQYWKDNVTISTFEIIPQRYHDGSMAASATATEQAAPRAFNERLAKLGGREFQSMMRIIRNVAKGNMTREAGVTLLKSSYGFTDEEINSLLTDAADGDIDL